MSAESTPRFAVYLLHFEQPIDGARHYVGITTPERLAQRMIEHTTGRGAKLTARACRLAVSWRLAQVWKSADFSLEDRLIARREAIQLCPVCRRISTGAAYRPTQKRPARELAAFTQLSLLDPLRSPTDGRSAQAHDERNKP